MIASTTNARLFIDSSNVVLATLGRFAHYNVLPLSLVTITSRPQRSMRCDRLVIRDAENWIIQDIRIGHQSQLGQAGDLPGDLFASTAIDTFIAFGEVQVGTDLVLTLSNIGTEPRVFNAVMIGRDAETNARLALPLTSSVPIAPGNGSDTDEGEAPGEHVILEIDDVLYHVTFVDQGRVAMVKIKNSDLSARALAEIDANLDLRQPSVVSIRALKPGVNAKIDDKETPDAYPYGLIVFDESIGSAILTIGAVCHEGVIVEWHPSGYQPHWLAMPAEDS